MEPVGRPPEVAHRDIAREESVQGSLEPGCRETSWIGERNHLPSGVNAGIRSTGPIDRLADSAGQVGQRGLQFPLDCSGVHLKLKARKVRAVIFNGCAVSSPNRDALSSA
jgi:hypothetical protein